MIKPALASAAAVVLAGTAVLLTYDLGPFSLHMILHIASMNVVAPLLATFVLTHRRFHNTSASWLWIAALSQIVLLWAWHSPSIYDAVSRSPVLELALHGTLFLAALIFWSAVLTLSAAARWQAIPALLLTGKLTCLLAALLIFAPRTLYSSESHLGHVTEGMAGLRPLNDQHLAGLLMITACPLSYLVAAVVIAVHLVGQPAAPGTILPRHRLPIGR